MDQWLINDSIPPTDYWTTELVTVIHYHNANLGSKISCSTSYHVVEELYINISSADLLSSSFPLPAHF